MARIRSQNEIVLNLLDFFRSSQPLLDTKPGTVARDLIIESISKELAQLYDEIGRVSTLQSLRLALGIDLDRLASNVGIKREGGKFSTGPGLLTFNVLDADIPVSKGDIITAKNGATFVIINSTVISPVFVTQYKSTAIKFRSDLDFVGITDQYAVEVLLQATATGTQGNISKYSLSSTSISGINNVTNISPFGGGKGVQDDNSFRNTILAIFSGANTGTSLGYRNAVKNDNDVIDAIVIEPGDPLMTRDGTQVLITSDGTRKIISEGTGGKVDIYIYGTRIQETIDSFIYRDLSNTNDPTNPKNDFVLGQIAGDAGKTVSRKRLDNIKNKIIPNQPVNNIISIVGSISGANYIEKNIDSLGRVTGNYELIRDTGAFGGSPWGYDRIHWISNYASASEDKTKQIFNSQDSLGFSDVLEINSIVQNISVINENSNVLSSDRSIIKLCHYPISNVTRVFNTTTGERYTVTNQNLDSTGKISISGKSLPAISDILQVDYTWIYTYDKYFDFDNRKNTNNIRVVKDSVDWGLSNGVKREKLTLIASGSYLSLTTTHNITSVISVNLFNTFTGLVTLVSGRLAIIVDQNVDNVISIIKTSNNNELWNSSINNINNSFSGMVIFLSDNLPVLFGDEVEVTYNAVDIYNVTDSSVTGNFNNNLINIIPTDLAIAGKLVECNYISNVNEILPSILLQELPAIRSSNKFSVNELILGNQPTTHIYSNNKILYNLRQAPSNLALNISGIISPGIITISGTTITGVFDVVFTVGESGLKQNLSSAIKKFLFLDSKTFLPSNIRISKIAKVTKVTTINNLEVITKDVEYDLQGYSLYDNSFVKSESIEDTSLKLVEFILPSTKKNISNSPITGNRLQISFYYTTTSDNENIYFSKSGTIYSNKKFCLIDMISKSSGFTSGSSLTATLSISNMNQPISRSRYKISYNYLAPKINERINIRFNYDRLITDATFAIENTRPINADVLAKSSLPILVDVTIRIGVLEDFKNNNSTQIVKQNVADIITSALNSNSLNTKIDASDLINKAYTVNGIDSARVIFFNKTGKTGSVLSISSGKNEYIQANNVIIELE